MIVPVQLPQYAMGMQDAVVLEWLVSVGDDVQEDQPIALVETEKAQTELVAPTAGRIASLLVQVDETVAVGHVMAEIENGA